MSEFDNIHFDDSDLEPEAIEAEQAQQQPQEDEEEDEFGDDFGDDLDLDELVEVSESVEQQHAANNGVNISFVPPTDPSPPPALPESTRSFHPLDVQNLRTWIYPTNYPVRGYQLNIVQKAMFNNTLVALPTGLGKTFIAAVVMYNYWRWFPNSLIIFMAPTRPLVTQQIEACFRICGLPQSETCDISGTTAPAKRRELYKSKRVFFATPQTINNDLKSKSCPADKIVCLVIDEAHKASGNYAYCGVIKKVSNKHKDFRVLALTATPGSKLETVQNVVDNLHISHIQIRTEESMDIREFSHGKNIQSITVPLGYTEGSTGILPKIIEEFKTEVFEPCIKKILSTPAAGSIPSNVDSVTTYGLTAARQRFTVTANNIDNAFKFRIVKQILVAEQMSRAYDLLCQHGIFPFLETVESHRQEFEELRSSGKKPGQPAENYYNNPYMNRIIPYLRQEVSKPDFIGHPKMDQLVSILLKHFVELPEGASSKVMIFSSFRSSVTEICKVLDRHKPLIRCSPFVGQSDGKNGLKGLKQSEQQEVIQKFKRDEFNVLVATSIGEEGLDIGEVDLIVCYDSQASPIRMLQRMGRAGRKRQGKCFMLMTELESKKFEQAKEAYARVQKLITQGTYLSYYKPNPTVIPVNYKPTICRKELSIGRYEHTEVKKKRRTASSAISVTPNVNADGLMTATTERQFLLSLSDDIDRFTNLSQVMGRYWPYKPMVESLRKVIPFQTKAKPIYRVANSSRTTQFVHLIEKMENRILNPNQDTEPSLPTCTTTKTQTTLKMPSKAGASSSTLKIPVRKKHKTQAEETDDAFADFMEQNDVSHFLNNASDENDDEHVPSPELNPRRVILEDFFAPRKKGKAKAVQPKSPPPPRLPALSTSAEDMSVDDLPSTPSGDPPIYSGPRYCGGWESPSPNSTHDVDMPDLPKATTTTSRNKGKQKMTASQEMSLMMDDDFDTTMDDERIVSEPILPKNLFEDAVPFENKPVSATELKLAKQKQQVHKIRPKSPEEDVMELDAGDNDFGESILDDMILEAENNALANLSAKGFDDELPPVFPFEKESQEKQTAAENSITFIWTQSTPTFSDKALQLLEKRQESMKELTGKFVAMNIIAKFKITDPPATAVKKKPSPILISTQSPPKQTLTFSQDFDDDFAFGSAFMEEAAAIEQNLQRNQETKEATTISKDCPIETMEEVSEEQAQEEKVQDEDEEAPAEQDEAQVEEDFAGFSDIDFDELSFTNIIENKLSDDEPGYHHFMHEEENYNYASQQASQMKERQSLYSDSSFSKRDKSTAPKTAVVNDTVKPHVTPKREEIFEIDFNDTPTPPSASAADEEVVYEYDFNNSSDDEKSATQSKAAVTPSPLSPVMDKTRLTSPQKVNNSMENRQVSDKSPVAEKIQHVTPLRENGKDAVQYSPNKLLQMSKGLAPPLAFSPVNNSPLRNTFAEDSDDSLSMPVRHRKRRVINFSPVDEDSDEEVRPTSNRRKKRLKRKSSTPLSTDEKSSVILLSNDEEDDDVVFAPPSRNTLLQRLQECKEDKPQRSAKKQRKIIQTLDDLAENPFMDVEAEKSSDEGHTSEEEGGGSSILNSFIDDDSLDPESHISVDDEVQDLNNGMQKKKKKVNMYMQSMMNDDVVAGNSKHWMNRFDANKWLNAGEDSIIEDDAESYEEEGEEEEDPESVTEFSSHLQPFNEDPIYNVDDEDDDFM